MSEKSPLLVSNAYNEKCNNIKTKKLLLLLKFLFNRPIFWNIAGYAESPGTGFFFVQAVGYLSVSQATVSKD